MFFFPIFLLELIIILYFRNFFINSSLCELRLSSRFLLSKLRVCSSKATEMRKNAELVNPQNWWLYYPLLWNCDGICLSVCQRTGSSFYTLHPRHRFSQPLAWPPTHPPPQDRMLLWMEGRIQREYAYYHHSLI